MMSEQEWGKLPLKHRVLAVILVSVLFIPPSVALVFWFINSVLDNWSLFK